MTRPHKAEVALEYQDELCLETFEPSARHVARRDGRFDHLKGLVMVTLGGFGIITAAMLVGWLIERVAG